MTTQDSMRGDELWLEVQEQKRKGVYPYTHLSHKQEEEVWIDPLSLPKDITTATLRSKGIPREWFHLPQGVEPPSTADLLKESSSDEEETPSSSDLHHSRICGRGRSRSKSKEKKLNKTIKKEAIQQAVVQQRPPQQEKKPGPLSEQQKPKAEVQFPGPPVPPKFVTSREPYPLPSERFTESEDDGEYELDTRWTSSETKRKSRSRSRDASKKSPKSPRLFAKALERIPSPPARTTSKSSEAVKRKEEDDGGYEPVGRKLKSFNPLSKDSNAPELHVGDTIKAKPYEDLPDSVIDLPFTKAGARISKKDFVTVESSQEGDKDLAILEDVPFLEEEEVIKKPEEVEPSKPTEINKKEQKRLEKERLEAEKKAKKEKERLAKEEQDRLKKLKKEQEKASKQEAERLKKEKKEQEKAEKLRIAKEKKASSKGDPSSPSFLPTKTQSIETTSNESSKEHKTPHDERLPTFFVMPQKESYEAQTTKTKGAVELDLDENERNPFVDYLAPKFRDEQPVDTIAADTQLSGSQNKESVSVAIPVKKEKSSTETTIAKHATKIDDNPVTLSNKGHSSNTTDTRTKVPQTDTTTKTKGVETAVPIQSKSLETENPVTTKSVETKTPSKPKSINTETPFKATNSDTETSSTPNNLETESPNKTIKNVETKTSEATKNLKTESPNKTIKNVGTKASEAKKNLETESPNKTSKSLETETLVATKSLNIEKTKGLGIEAVDKTKITDAEILSNTKDSDSKTLNSADSSTINALNKDTTSIIPGSVEFKSGIKSSEIDQFNSKAQGFIFSQLSNTQKDPKSQDFETKLSHQKDSPFKIQNRVPTFYKMETESTIPVSSGKTKVEADFEKLFQASGAPKAPPTQIKIESGASPSTKKIYLEDPNKIDVIPESSSRTRKYSERKSSFQEYDEDQDLIYDPEEEKLAEAVQERMEHLLHGPLTDEDEYPAVEEEKGKPSKKEKKELKKLEKEKKKADKIDKEQTLRQQKLQERMEKQMIANEKKDLEVAARERKKSEKDWLKHQKQEEKKQAKLEKEESKKLAKLEKEEEKRLAKLEKRKNKRTFFKVLQKKGKAKSLSDLNENDPLIVKEYHFEDEEEDAISPVLEEEDKKNPPEETRQEVTKSDRENSPTAKTPQVNEATMPKKELTPPRDTELTLITKPFKSSKKDEKVMSTTISRENNQEPLKEPVLNGISTPETVPKNTSLKTVETDSTGFTQSEKKPEANMMASKPSSLRDDFAAFSSRGGAHEENIDFTPQNGYVIDEQAMEDMGYIAVDEDVEDGSNKRKSRERRKFKVGLQKSVSNFNSKIRNARLPSPHELKEGLVNCNLNKSFHQPLVARSRVENVDVQKARALLVKHNTPSELAKMKHPLDIPFPKFGGGENKPEKPVKPTEVEQNGKPKENGFTENRPGSKAGGKMYQTLPRSWRETQLITAVRENGDPELLAERQELVRTKTPSELAQLHSISDFPVPSRLTNLFHPSAEGDENKKEGQGSSAKIDKPKEPFRMENMIPSSLRETKLITNVREMTDQETIRSRQNLVQQNTPGELAKFHSLSDFPVPTRIENIFKPRSRSSSATRKNTERRASTASHRSRSLTRSLSGTIPRSWRETQLLTGVKVDSNQEEIARRRALIQNTTPAELSKITSVADLPVPTALQNIFSGSKTEKDMPTEEKSSKPMNLEEMYNNLPRSLKTELLVKCVESDQDITKKRQKLVESMKPSELAQIGSLSEFPIPSVLENIFKEKDETATPRPEKRARNKTVIGLMSYENMPESLKKELLVRSEVEEDPEVLMERRELLKSKTPAELSRMSGLSDFPLPEKIEGLVRPSRRNLKSTKEKDMTKKRSKSWSSLTNPKELYNSLPDSLKSEVLVSVTVEDKEALKEHKKLVEENSVAELGQIHGLSDFPVPDAIVNLVKTDPNKASRPATPAKSLRENFMDAMPESMKSDLLVRSRTEDPELLKERQELTRSKTPNELSQISSISDFPIPTSVENMFKKKEYDENEPTPPPRRFKKETLYESLPNSLKSEVLVRSKVEEDPEVLKAHQELVRSKSPAELSEIHGLEDIPIPSFLTKRKEDSDDASSKKDPEEDPKSLYEKMPDSLKTEMLVRARVEMPEIQKERSELVKNKTVKELSEINGLDDIPIPNLQFLKRKGQENENEEGAEKEKKTLYEQMPESLKAEVLVRACVEDPEVTKENADLVKSKTVKELSEIRGLSDIPMPTQLEYVVGRKPRPVERRKKFREKQRSQSAKNLHERMYDSIPQSLKAELLVKSVYQDSDVHIERRRLVQSKSVGELSQINSLSEFPVPSVIERLMAKSEGPTGEGPSLSRMSLSNISLSRKSLYSALPKSLTTQDCLVRSRIEDPEVLRERQEIVKTKSVSELATLNSISDFPIPSNVERFIQNRRSKSVDQPRILLDGDSRPTSPIEKLREKIPSSMKTELLVSSSVQDPKTSQRRKQLTESTSVHELSQLHGISDFPVPDTIQNFVKDRLSRNENREEAERVEKSGPNIDLYASLPKSLKQEVLVRSLVQEGDQDLMTKKALAESKSPAELSQIHSFSEIPVPSRIEAWLSSTDESKLGHPIAPPRSARSFHELRENMYETLPKSLKEPTLVRTKVEDPELQKNRAELTRSKTPSQLAEIHGINEIPIPGLWNDGSPKKKSNGSLAAHAAAVPRTKQEIKDYVYKTLFPESLVRPCIVRSKVEDQGRLLERQAIQQSKTIHELSKINNLSDFPLPGNMKLPPIPLPSTKGILKIITPSKKKQKEADTHPEGEVHEDNQTENQYNQVEDSPYDNSGLTDDEMLRYESSTPAESLIREQDFGYEVISASEAREEQEQRHRESDILNIGRVPDKFKDDIMRETSPRLEPEVIKEEPQMAPMEEPIKQELDDEDSQLVDHYRGTPPRALGRSKMKNKKNRQSQDSVEGEHNVERIQSRPLPAPPTPVRSRGKAPKKDAQTGTVEVPPTPTQPPKDSHSSITTTHTEVFHTVQSSLDQTLVKSRPSYDHDDETLADSVVDSMHSCAETLVDEDATLHEDLRDEDIFTNDPIYPRTGSVEERLKNETHELSRELLEHVENLRTTLGNMSTRLGTTSPEPPPRK